LDRTEPNSSVRELGQRRRLKKRGHPTAASANSLLRRQRGEQGVVEAGLFGGGGVASGVAKETTREAVFLSRPVIIMLITLIYRQINSQVTGHNAMVSLEDQSPLLLLKNSCKILPRIFFKTKAIYKGIQKIEPTIFEWYGTY
jgi:hypothetical protein